MARTTRRPATSRGARFPHRPPAPRPRDRHVLRAAVGRRPEPEKRRAEAFVSYVRALPAEADSIGAIRAHFADDLHALFEGGHKHHLQTSVFTPTHPDTPDPRRPPVAASEAAVENGYLKPEHLSSREWAALPQLVVGGTADWQDVSVRPVGGPAGGKAPTLGFTVEVCTNEVLEGDHDTSEGCVTAAGPHPRELLPSQAGEEAALDVGRMAVYLARPFTPAEALAWTELLLVEAGVPVHSLEEVGVDEYYAGLAGRSGA